MRVIEFSGTVTRYRATGKCGLTFGVEKSVYHEDFNVWGGIYCSNGINYPDHLGTRPGTLPECIGCLAMMAGAIRSRNFDLAKIPIAMLEIIHQRRLPTWKDKTTI